MRNEPYVSIQRHGNRYYIYFSKPIDEELKDPKRALPPEYDPEKNTITLVPARTNDFDVVKVLSEKSGRKVEITGLVRRHHLKIDGTRECGFSVQDGKLIIDLNVFREAHGSRPRKKQESKEPAKSEKASNEPQPYFHLVFISFRDKKEA